MSLSERLRADMRLPVIGSPMFIVSNPELVIAQCTAGIIGAFPALNARPAEQLPVWLERITNALAAERGAPAGPDRAVRGQPDRACLQRPAGTRSSRLCGFPRAVADHEPARPAAAVEAARDYGGHVFHDVISVRHAEKAIEAGVDGLIVVCAGAGGHAGTLSPFALVSEIGRFWDGPLVLSGAITRGAHILAAEALGADFAYMGTCFIATDEANAAAEYKTVITTSSAKDIVYSNLFTGVHGNYLRGSIENAGLDPHDLPTSGKQAMSFGSDSKKAWKDIWGAGQGVGNIDAIEPAANVVEQLVAEYNAARQRLGAR